MFDLILISPASDCVGPDSLSRDFERVRIAPAVGQVGLTLRAGPRVDLKSRIAALGWLLNPLHECTSIPFLKYKL